MSGHHAGSILRIVVLLSGTGSLTRALIEAAGDHKLGGEVVAVGSDRADAGGLTHAAEFGIDTFVVEPSSHRDRIGWNAALANRIADYQPDLIVSAGFMRILGSPVLDRFPDMIINSHPSLLPAFPGAHAVSAALHHGVRVTGCTVHVVDSGVDTGPILAQRCVPIETGDTEAQLHERIKVAERNLLPEVVAQLGDGRLRISGGKVTWT